MGDSEKSTMSVMKVLRFSFLVLFTGLCFFSMGVFVGKKWSDRRYISELKGQKRDKLVEKKLSGKRKAYLRKNKTKIRKKKKAAGSFDRVRNNFREGDSGKSSEKTSYASIVPSQILSNDFVEVGVRSKPVVLPENQSSEGAGETVSPNSSEISAVGKRFSLRSGRKIKNKNRFYTIQVAAYRTEKEAQEHIQDLVDKGFPAFLFEKDIKGEKWFRVNIGSLKQKKRLSNMKKPLKNKPGLKSLLFAESPAPSQESRFYDG